MRSLVIAAVLVALVGCSKSPEVGGKPIGEPKGFRFLRKSDPVGTVVYERGLQWVNSDHAPTLLGVLKQGPHTATDGLFKGQEVITIEYDGTKTLNDDPVELAYEGGIRFVKD